MAVSCDDNCGIICGRETADVSLNPKFEVINFYLLLVVSHLVDRRSQKTSLLLSLEVTLVWQVFGPSSKMAFVSLAIIFGTLFICDTLRGSLAKVRTHFLP